MNTVKIQFSRCRSECKPFLLRWCSGIRSSAFRMFPMLSVMWWLLYFVPCDGHQVHFSCGQLSHLRCLPSLTGTMDWHDLIASLVAFLLPLEVCALTVAFVVVSIRQCGPSQRHKHADQPFWINASPLIWDVKPNIIYMKLQYFACPPSSCLLKSLVVVLLHCENTLQFFPSQL